MTNLQAGGTCGLQRFIRHLETLRQSLSTSTINKGLILLASATLWRWVRPGRRSDSTGWSTNPAPTATSRPLPGGVPRSWTVRREQAWTDAHSGPNATSGRPPGVNPAPTDWTPPRSLARPDCRVGNPGRGREGYGDLGIARRDRRPGASSKVLEHSAVSHAGASAAPR